jgi:hypothetical protein
MRQIDNCSSYVLIRFSSDATDAISWRDQAQALVWRHLCVPGPTHCDLQSRFALKEARELVRGLRQGLSDEERY